MQSCDVVIVGGGIGGSALGASLAELGLSVRLLERETEFVDRVRGEFLAPWGVTESRTLGIYDLLMDAGGHHVTRHIGYDNLLTPAQAEAGTLPLGDLSPGVPGPLCMEHVVMQNALLDNARAHKVDVLRGVSKVTAQPGAEPSVAYTYQGERHSCSCRLIVGADGRSSTVRRQLGLGLKEQPVDHLISGLLVDDAHDWPEDLQAVGRAGDLEYLIFPQGGGKVRLYVDYDLSERGRYTGEKGVCNLLAAFDVDCIPGGRGLANARPIGPCQSYPSQDATLDELSVDGVVLMGDAAGYTDPIVGQGLSVALRDARLIRDALQADSDWSKESFSAYQDERRERVRRIRCIARFAATLFVNCVDDEQRARAFGRIGANSDLGGLLLATFAGPESVPAEVFTEQFHNAIFSP
jgi:menaquinone-9 beta-reductase